MRRFYTWTLVTFLSVTLNIASASENVATIYLKDGSVLKGEVVEMTGVYVKIRADFGVIQIDRTDVDSISFSASDDSSADSSEDSSSDDTRSESPWMNQFAQSQMYEARKKDQSIALGTGLLPGAGLLYAGNFGVGIPALVLEVGLPLLAADLSAVDPAISRNLLYLTIAQKLTFEILTSQSVERHNALLAYEIGFSKDIDAISQLRRFEIENYHFAGVLAGLLAMPIADAGFTIWLTAKKEYGGAFLFLVKGISTLLYFDLIERREYPEEKFFGAIAVSGIASAGILYSLKNYNDHWNRRIDRALEDNASKSSAPETSVHLNYIPVNNAVLLTWKLHFSM